MKIDGACHCGRITYEAEIDPSAVGVCHCTDCQTFSSSAFRAYVPAKREKFRLSGEPREYLKTAESGAKRVQAFCPDCGTPIYSAAPGDSPVFNLRVGAVRQRAQLSPHVQVWTRSAVGWLDGLASVKRLEKQG
jgi:hypothetical protein